MSVFFSMMGKPKDGVDYRYTELIGVWCVAGTSIMNSLKGII